MSAPLSGTFTLQNGAVTLNDLSSFGAVAEQNLSFDGTSWTVSNLGSLSFAGNWNASTNVPDLSSGASPGEFYIVSTAGSFDLLGGAGTNSWQVGDWAVWNNVLNRFEKIANATVVTSFNGRNSVITPMANDYTWAQIDKTTSSIFDIANVSNTGLATGSILKWDGTNWLPSPDETGITTGSINSSSITDGSISNADINSAAAISQSKVDNLTTDLASKLSLTGGTMTGALDMGSQNITNAGTVNGINITTLNSTQGSNSSTISSNTTAIGNKENTITATTTADYFRGDKTFTTLNTSAVTESSNLYFTDARARTASVINNTSGSETDQAASVAAAKSYIDTTINPGGDFKSDGSVALTGDLNMNNNNIDNVGNIELTSSIQIADDPVTCDGSQLNKLRYENGFLLFCNGTQWMEVVFGARVPNITINPNSQSTMNIVGGVSPGNYVSFTVTNEGSANSSSLATSLSNTTNFEIGTDNCNGQVLAAASSCTIQVRPKSTINGSYSTTLTISSTEKNISSNLSGTATGFVPQLTPNLASWLSTNGYTEHGTIAGHQIVTASIPANEHVYIFFDSLGAQAGATRIVGYYDQITDRPHPFDAGNDTSFTSLEYWNGTGWSSGSWTKSFCLSGDGSSGVTSTVWISCPGTHNPEKTNWALLFAGSANWSGWRIAFLNESGLMSYIISSNSTGSDTSVTVYKK